MKNCSILIPTFNRPNYLRRLLSYYNKFGENYNIIIADSSSNDNKKLNKKSVLIFSNLDIHYIDKYPSKIEASHKINNALNYVNTKYCVVCADDDFITPNGINKSVEFLENSQDFSVAQGNYIPFCLGNEDKREVKIRWRSSPYLDKSITFPEAESRLASHLSNYQLTTFYAVHRTDLLKMIYNETIKYTEDVQFGELLPSMLTLIYGKMKHMNVLYCARERMASSDGNTGKNINDFIKEGTYKKKYTKFRECLVGHLIKKSHLNNDEAEELIDEAMSKYLNKCKSKSFKGILFDKMSTLMKALHLPEFIDENVRMLYRKIFIPEISYFKSTIKSPNSKYPDDFSKIFNHVLLSHTKNQTPIR